MDNKVLKFKKGFSLVELLVVLAIMLIMTAVLLANQNNNKAQNNVENAAKQVATQLRSLQNEALNGKRIGTDPVCDFIFTSANGETKYSISYTKYASSENSCLDNPNNHIIISTQPIELNSGKKNVSITTNSTILFRSPLAEVNASSDKIIFMSNDSTNPKLASVCVCPSGKIFEQKNDAICVC